MKYVKNIFLILVFALSATAFSTSAMAASETK
ncbi:PagK family vesicle-borne virulence factor, partial [Salmonella enterica]